jgi:hypothetical protein
LLLGILIFTARRHKKKTPDIQFHLRVVNHTDIMFTAAATTFLEKGMQYNLHHKPKHWQRNLACEAESASSQLPQKAVSVCFTDNRCIVLDCLYLLSNF